MSCDGKETSTDPQSEQADDDKKYRASLFQYRCFGHVGASAGDPLYYQNRRCFAPFGMKPVTQSPLPMSRQQAIQDFSSRNDGEYTFPEVSSSVDHKLRTQAVITDEKRQSNAPRNHEWDEVDCYGMCDVQVLVLEEIKTKERKVTSVAPHCVAGLSVRDVGTTHGSALFNRFRLGSIFDAHLFTPGVAPPSSHSEPASDTSFNGTTFANKVGENMMFGGRILKDAVSENFPSRMLDAGSRVVGELPFTAVRTGIVARSMYQLWFGSNDDSYDKD